MADTRKAIDALPAARRSTALEITAEALGFIARNGGGWTQEAAIKALREAGLSPLIERKPVPPAQEEADANAPL